MEKGAVGSQKLTRQKHQLYDISEFKNTIKKIINQSNEAAKEQNKKVSPQ